MRKSINESFLLYSNTKNIIFQTFFIIYFTKVTKTCIIIKQNQSKQKIESSWNHLHLLNNRTTKTITTEKKGVPIEATGPREAIHVPKGHRARNGTLGDHRSGCPQTERDRSRRTWSTRIRSWTSSRSSTANGALTFFRHSFLSSCFRIG